MNIDDFLLERLTEDRASYARLGGLHDLPEKLMAKANSITAIIGWHSQRPGAMDGNESWSRPRRECRSCGAMASTPAWPCPTLRALAAAYADHPDYDQEWRA